MRHSSVQTTHISVKITNQKVNEDIKLLSNQSENKYELPKDESPKFHHNQYYVDKTTGKIKYIKNKCYF